MNHEVVKQLVFFTNIRDEYFTTVRTLLHEEILLPPEAWWYHSDFRRNFRFTGWFKICWKMEDDRSKIPDKFFYWLGFGRWFDEIWLYSRNESNLQIINYRKSIKKGKIILLLRNYFEKVMKNSEAQSPLFILGVCTIPMELPYCMFWGVGFPIYLIYEFTVNTLSLKTVKSVMWC